MMIGETLIGFRRSAPALRHATNEERAKTPGSLPAISFPSHMTAPSAATASFSSQLFTGATIQDAEPT